jgi:hypothetical protein
MKRYLQVFVALATSPMSGAFAPSMKASELDKTTAIALTQPIAVKGVSLPPAPRSSRRLDSPAISTAPTRT